MQNVPSIIILNFFFSDDTKQKITKSVEMANEKKESLL